MLLRVVYAFLVNWPSFFVNFFVKIVARRQYYLDFLEFTCVFILPINQVGVVIVPIKAEKISVLIAA